MFTALAVLLAADRRADASLITYTETDTASGSLGGTPFTDALVTIVFTGDTADVTGGGGVFFNEVGTVTVTVAGLGTATFTDSMEINANQSIIPSFVGIGDNTVAGTILGTESAGLSSYDLMTSIGPVSGIAVLNPGHHTFNTTSGDFTLTSDVAGTSIFTADATVPEPSSVFLLGSGLAGFAWMQWGRRAAGA
jgi:PEP-CTERM motif